VVDGETGYVIDASNQSAMVEAIVRLLRDPAHAREMGRKGREHVAARFCGATALGPLLAWLDQGVPWCNQ
jgi:hypothetical protein